VISLDWSNIIGSFLLIAGLCGVIIVVGVWLADKFNASSRDWIQIDQIETKPDKPTATRSADAGPPPGAVEWVVDIIHAMGAAHASCILEALSDSCTRDQARARRIEQLEAHKPAVPPIGTPWLQAATEAISSIEHAQAISNAQLGIKAEVTT
jgi:hypothetical protein